ncbi:hypothetical protein Tco_0568377 [Tanacetum coccineum]
MCKAYGGEPNVELLRAFLNLGPAEMDFRSFKMEVIDGEFNFLPKEDIGNEGGGEELNVSKATGKPSDPLDVDSDPDIHGKLSPFIHLVVTHVTPPSWKHHLKEISLETICDIHDKAYMRRVILDNVMNRRTRELMSTLLEARAACDAIREKEKEKDKVYVKLKAKWAGRKVAWEYSILVLEENKWVNYKQTLITLRSKEIDGLKQNRVVMVVKVVLHVVAELARSDEMGFHVTRLIKMTIIHGRCTTFEEVATLKMPFKLEKMPNYHPFSKKVFDQASDDLAAASYPFLAKATIDPYTPLEVLLSNKPKSLCVKAALSHSQLKSKPSVGLKKEMYLSWGERGLSFVAGYTQNACVQDDLQCWRLWLLVHGINREQPSRTYVRYTIDTEVALKLLGFMRVNVLSKCINTAAIANTMRFTTVHVYVLPGDGRGLWKVVLNIEVIYGSFYDLAMIME